MRILVANEPRSYREVLATAFQGLRPHIETQVIEPEDLDPEALCGRPDLVICDLITPSLEAAVRFWIEYRVKKEALVVTATNAVWLIRGADDLGLDGLLSVVDQIEELGADTDRT